MKTLSTGLCLATTALLTAMLAGCVATQEPQQSGAQVSGGGPSPAMHGGSGAGAMGMGAGRGMGMMTADRMAACRDMQQKMAQAKTPEERQAIMQEHMNAMSPEMRQWMHEHMGARPCQ